MEPADVVKRNNWGHKICIHDRRKSQCKECGGSEICIHDRQKSQCKECGGASICIHNRIKAKCKECGGSEICIHNLQKSACKECNPVECPDVNCSFVSYKSSVTRHYKSFHTEAGIKRHKKEEERIEKLLNKFNVNFTREHNIDFKCISSGTNARVDFIIQDNGRLIFLEVDENQHNDRNIGCECTRMSKIHETLAVEGNTIPITFIRYNPNAFKIDGITQKITKAVREVELIKTLLDRSHMIYTNDKPLAILYLNYSTINKLPEITYDIDYNDVLKLCIL